MGVANLREKTPAGHPAELVNGGWWSLNSFLQGRILIGNP